MNRLLLSYKNKVLGCRDMDKEIERLNKQLAHLEKSYKAGVVKKSEFLKGKKKVERKIKQANEKVQDRETKTAAITKIINKPKSKKNNTKEKKPDVIINNKQSDKTHNNKSKKRYDDEKSSIWSYLLLLLVIVVVLFFVYKYTETLAPTTDTITMYEYSNFFCSHCDDLQDTLKEIKKDYGVKIKIYHRQFPNDAIHPLSTLAAEASECANDQNKFIEYHNLLFVGNRNKKITEKTDLIELAEMSEVEDIETFKKCLENHEKLEEIQADIDEGEKAGVKATPTLVINGEVLQGAQSYNVIASVINKHLG